MIFDNYSTQAAEASLDALWLKTQVISNNLSNVDTPGFKQSHVSFDEVFRRTSQRSGTSEKSRGTVYRTRVTTEDNRSVRVDGNNVQEEDQQLELWKTQAQYSYLIDRVTGHYNLINSAMNNMR